jgi:hypothetical protein
MNLLNYEANFMQVFKVNNMAPIGQAKGRDAEGQENVCRI